MQIICSLFYGALRCLVPALMYRIHPESSGLGCPLLADEFLEHQPLESLASEYKVVGNNKVGQMLPQLSVVVIVKALNGDFLEGPVHPLDLPIGPRMLVSVSTL